MRTRLVEVTLMIALLFVVPRARADQNQAPADDALSEVAVVWFDTLYEVVKPEAIASRGRLRVVAGRRMHREITAVKSARATEFAALTFPQPARNISCP